MSANEEDNVLTVLSSSPEARRAAVLLLSAERVAGLVASDPEAFQASQRALRLCWEWMSGANVKPEALALYLDAAVDRSFELSELRFPDGSPGQKAMIFVQLVIGYLANWAYRKAGREKSMSEVICECDDLRTVVKCGWDVGLAEIVEALADTPHPSDGSPEPMK